MLVALLVVVFASPIRIAAVLASYVVKYLQTKRLEWQMRQACCSRILPTGHGLKTSLDVVRQTNRQKPKTGWRHDRSVSLVEMYSEILVDGSHYLPSTDLQPAELLACWARRLQKPLLTLNMQATVINTYPANQKQQR